MLRTGSNDLLDDPQAFYCSWPLNYPQELYIYINEQWLDTLLTWTGKYNPQDNIQG